MATVNPDVFQRFKKAKKVSSRQEGDGHEVVVEIREDEEQTVKLQEIIDLLVAAGYFRARIKGLSPFDKVVGGMTWCIESCNVDVDIDLLFQENSTIGQKIALTEKIVAVLPKMKCPHSIEPHQIQGLDFIHIYPVIQWLVKRSMEFREEMSAFVHSYAVNQFNKEFPLKNKNLEKQKRVLQNVKAVNEVYRPQRFYKRKNAPPPDIHSRVQVTLLEYGHRGGESQSTPHLEVSDNNVLDTQQSEERKIQQLLKGLTVTNEETFEYDLNDEEKEKLAKHYAQLQSELKDGGVQSQKQIETETLEEQLYILSDRCKKLEIESSSAQEEIHKDNSYLRDLRLKQANADIILKQFEQTEASSPESVKQVEELVKLNEELRKKEMLFRETCKRELAELHNKIEEAGKAANTPVETNKDFSKQFEEGPEKVKIMRLQVAKKSRIVASLQRQLDDVPDRAELAQYQRRFLELYNQVAAKHKETKQYYTLYNTLEDTRIYMEKELSLLNSISDNYPEAMESNLSKEEFLKQFQYIVDGVKQSKLKVEEKVKEEKGKRDALSHTLHGLVELQRKYVVAVRQLSIECKKHEALLARTQK